MSLLEICALRVDIAGQAILKEVSLQVGEGEAVGLVGASGSGKSTTALATLRLLPARATAVGRIQFGSLDVLTASDARMQSLRGREIGMVFQEPATALNPLMSVLDQVAEVVRVHLRAGRLAARYRAAAALEKVGLPSSGGFHRRFPHELSGGQRQRAAIAMATVLEPRLLIADEPTAALDARSRLQVLALLEELVRTRRAALLIISHDLGLVERMAQRVVVMQDGVVVESGDTRRMLSQPRHLHAQELIAARPSRSHAPMQRGADAGELARIDDGAAETILSVRNLVCAYAHGRHLVRAVDGVSFQIAQGESLGLVGESGAGKSTLLRAVLGIGRIQEGEVCVAGELFAAPGRTPRSAQRRSMQCVLQDPAGSLDPRWRVREIIAEPLHLLCDSRASAAARVAALLERVGLASSDAARYPHEFSGGQRQRIAIARALAIAPALIVLDEAVSALDVLTRAQILRLLAELSRETGTAYIFVSHDLDVVRAMTDRVIVLEKGRIVESGATSSVLTTPQHIATRQLVDASPRQWLESG